MSRIKVVQMDAQDIGMEKAEMMATMIEHLKKRGVKDDLIEKIAVNASGADDSNGNGFCGVLDPMDYVSNPAIRGMAR